VSIKPGEIVAVCGSVGSGKSTIINGIIRDAICLEGSVEVGGSLAYVPQTSWIQHASVRDNILFGRPMDHERYRRAVFACALERDFEILEYGDMTEIGEAGINLSGGQRQRISLARAAYSNADVYLLDSPLSAVDHFTGNHIFEHCIRNMLRGKTVILVTHNLHLLSYCDKVIVCKAGQVAFCGTYSDDVIRTHFPAVADSVLQPHEKIRHDEKPTPNPVEAAIKPKTTMNQAAPTVSEQKLLTTKSVFLAWFRQGTRFGFLVAVIIAAGTQLLRIFSDLYVRTWATSSEEDMKSFPAGDYALSNARSYILTYFGLVLGFIIMLFIRGVSFFFLTLRAATRLHNKMFRSILKAPLSFFTVTPMGPLLNCFSRQMDQVDETLPDALHMGIIYFMILVTTVGVIISVIPYFVLVVAALVGLFLYLQSHTAAATKTLKYGVGKTNPDLFSHSSETLHGMSVVRAYRAEERFRAENVALLNRNHSVVFHADQLQFWMAFRVNLVAALSVFATALFCVGLRNDITAGSAGLAISNALQMLVFLTMLVKAINEVRGQITSVESIVHFMRNTKSEKVESKAELLDAKWPPNGRIEFSNVVMRYFANSEPVLNHLSFVIEPRQKIGIVGRTGSGKSTLLIALFRLVELCEGTIYVDGVDISRLNLTDLRRSLSIIPQDPVMFKGTVRTNLDPFGEHSDEQLWRAVELSHLRSDVEGFEKKLDHPVDENGANMSLGQKQLFCLARAVLRDSTILVLDEATAALDLETDALIQRTIRDVFYNRTILTIAHRLATIMDYDKILYLDKGHVLEYDFTSKLLADPNSHFVKLLHG
jgi:ABC-type multidrug transport system fused ATPase/permease subunit